MGERITMIVAILAVFLSIIAIVSSLGVKPADIDVNSVGTKELMNGSVNSDKILDNSILPNDLHDSVVDYIVERFYIPDNSISSRHIINKSIDKDDLANSSVGSEEIIDFSVGKDDIQNRSITREKLADDAIQWDDIKNIPIQTSAAGFIKNDGTLEYGYNVLSVQYETSTRSYNITIDNYNPSNKYVTIVSTLGLITSSQVAYTSDSISIWLINATGDYQKSDFYFVTYKINQ